MFLCEGPGRLTECLSETRVLTGQSSLWDLSITQHILSTHFSDFRVLLKSRHLIYLKITSRIYSLFLVENQNSSSSVSVFLTCSSFFNIYQRSPKGPLHEMLGSFTTQTATHLDTGSCIYLEQISNVLIFLKFLQYVFCLS